MKGKKGADLKMDLELMQLAMERAQLMQVSRMEICIGNPMIEFLLQQAFKNIEMTSKAMNSIGGLVADLK